MAQTYAIVESDVVVNTALAKAPLESNWVLITGEAGIGWAYQGGAFVEPAPPPVTADDARTTRNTLLAASDWTQVADAPVDQAAWATYRQALRDITAQAGFPKSIDWPVQPV